MKPRLTILASLILVLALLLYPAVTSGAEAGRPLHLARQAVIDTNGFGYDAFSVLVPSDWAFGGWVDWQFRPGVALFYLQHQQQIAEAMSQIASSQSEIGDMITAGYARRSATMDRMHERHVQAIRGVETYRSPMGDAPRVELPAGYNQAWTNGNEFILSNDPRFDPAGVGRGGWTAMERDQR